MYAPFFPEMKQKAIGIAELLYTHQTLQHSS